MWRRNQQLTVIVIPQTDRHTLNFRLPVWLLGAAGVLAVIFVLLITVGGAVFLRQYQEVGLAKKERELLRQEASRKEQQLQRMSERVHEIEVDLTRVQELERQVRQLLVEPETGVSSSTRAIQPEERIAQGASVGGPTRVAGTNVMPQGEDQRLFSAYFEETPSSADGRRLSPRVDRAAVGARAGVALTARPEVVDTQLLALRDQGTWLMQSLPQAAEAYRNKLHFDSHRPIGLPVQGRITDTYGWRRSPFADTREWHEGIDIASDWGEPILATADGEVIFSDWKAGGYGYTVVIDHGYGFRTLYAHHSALVAKVGDQVRRGDTIAQAGSTGRSTGPHVHYEVHVWGQATDPAEYLR